MQKPEPSRVARLPLAGEAVAGRYRVAEELGRGGMCAVVAARDETLGRDVALKVLLPHLSSSAEITERFANEARSLARMESSHVVRVLDFGVMGQPQQCLGLPFMVLELLRGADLFCYAAGHGTLSPERVVRLALQACDGLAAAHAEGIIHRDLKPENLFVAVEPDGAECLKVLDFGIARGRDARALTSTRAGLGSPGYMSPEQVERSSEVDARSDIWSLGIVMYELLANRPAFPGKTPQELCMQILNAPLAPLGELRPDLPPALVYIVERCLERDVERRFQDVGQLAEALAPLDDWSPMNEATRIQRRLARNAVQTLLPAQEANLPTALPATTFAESRPGHVKSSKRRVLSALLAAVVLVPIVALLPPVLRSPQLSSVREWSRNATATAGAALGWAREAAVELWTDPPAPTHSTPAHPAPR